MENGLHGRLYILKVAGSCAQFPSSPMRYVKSNPTSQDFFKTSSSRSSCELGGTGDSYSDMRFFSWW